MKIAITGTLGSGKSMVTRMIHHEFGYVTYSSDELVKDAYEDENIKAKLIETFGSFKKEDIKAKLKEVGTTKLNEIIHPYVINRIKNILVLNDKQDVFVEVPLLFELNLNNLFDKVICVAVDDSIRHERLQKRDINSYNSMLVLEKFQLDSKIKEDKSDFVIYNNADIDTLKEKVKEVINSLIGD